MRKNKYLKIIILIFTVLTILSINSKAHAIPLCLADEKDAFQSKIYKIKNSFELKRSGQGDGVAYYSIIFNNVDPDLTIIYNGIYYDGNSANDTTYIDQLFEPNTTVEFEIRVKKSASKCPNSLLGTKKVKLPYYNKYSEDPKCIEYEEFPLCHANYEGKIESYEDFNKQFNEYLEELESQLPKYNDDRNIFQILIDLYVDNIEISVTITALIILIIVLYFVRKLIRRIKRTKIKF